MLSRRAMNCVESPTLSISAKAKSMKAEGIDVIDLGAGQPDLEPPEFMKDAIRKALDNKGSGKYTAASGTPALKQAIVDKLKRDNNVFYDQDQVIVNCGAKHTIYNIMQAMIDDGDEVIIPKPFWVSYPDIVRLADGKPVITNTDEEFKIKASFIQEKITPKTKIIIINSPSNPTGAVIDDDELKEIAKIAVENDIYVVSDEIYEKIIYDKKHLSIASIGEDIKEKTLTVNGLSKSHAIPGWRLGYCAGPVNIIKAMGNIQAQSISNPISLVQEAAIAALTNPDDEVKKMAEEFKKRRDLIVDRLNNIKGWSCNKPDGAFYVFPKIHADNDVAFAEQLLENAKVALVPGEPFGMPGHVRISYAASMEELEKGCDRIEKFVRG